MAQATEAQTAQQTAIDMVPTTWQMRDLWMKRTFAGPTEKWDHEAEFWQWVDNIRAGYPERAFNLDVSADELLALWMKIPFAGPSEKYDREQGFFQWMKNLRAGR